MERQTLASFSDHQREEALKKYTIIEPYLKKQQGIKEISLENEIPIRTLYRWVDNFEKNGLVGLIRKVRSDFGQLRISEEVSQIAQKFVLKHKKISTKTLYRKIVLYCSEHKIDPPSYAQIYRFRKSMPKSLIKLAYDGDKAYKESYDLITIREASRQNLASRSYFARYSFT
ncbi:hypothetical protein IGI96_003667 [Enterococcus sp. DIV0421]|uniref:helix-turn-helix domain containing protein n=1 Tax=Enterococcus sp. DIV0421 TaxID=2774688 RepID=UPI003F238BED